ncbi:hypothetical protein ACZ11_23870 [Lysinibacillus xylanilyticus]|uniref:Uncharacterized protein n=1 Tax=Lysinibacillus xylanilyticus TaxID=582475 RepID=A0A0K9F119_9BACI|nr:hypothetical protein [Lysinibacillus xylanilyticus]KMY28274.1 hypothetical protein ACZ11_23870 [Lysinibacillus xylanilyticus]
MKRKYIANISLVIAFILGIPFKWIQYKGSENVSILQILDLGINNLFFDFTLLGLNTLIIYLVLSRLLKKWVV